MGGASQDIRTTIDTHRQHAQTRRYTLLPCCTLATPRPRAPNLRTASSQLLLHRIDSPRKLLPLRLLDSPCQSRGICRLERARKLGGQSLEQRGGLAHQLLLCGQLGDCLDPFGVEDGALEHATHDRVVGLFARVDELGPQLDRLAQVRLGHEEPVVGVLQQLLRQREACVPLDGALDEGVLDAAYDRALRHLLAHLVDLVHREPLGAHAEHQARVAQRRLHLFNQLGLAGDDVGGDHRRGARARRRGGRASWRGDGRVRGGGDEKREHWEGGRRGAR
mmetsp:Transcript_38900/g.96645  ORF Transcript_38900/g.96645 Transcript_38900/m.96645 type:complete len:278 (-) Transcript_38900:35-868(-)